MATNFIDKNISSIQLENVKYNLKSIPFHATEAEWSTINYVPKEGETIIYDTDNEHSYFRFKTGDGTTQASLLPFSLTTFTEVEIYINRMVGSAGHLKRVVLGTDEDLPNIEDAEIDTIYMKASTSNNTQLNNSYVEFMVINGIWEIIGNTVVDLSNYLTKNEADEKYL